MGFSVRLAPGVRVRASSRGVRTSLGPRVARVHVGGGRPGVSTGVGPISYYSSLGSGQRPRTTGGTAAANRQLVAAARTQAQADKLAEAQHLSDELARILDLHREDFSPATKPIATPPPQVPLADIQRRHRAEAKRATSFFARENRRQALLRADVLAAEEAERTRREQADQTAQYQYLLDAWWSALEACEGDVVLATLAKAFEDNEAAAAAMGVDGREVTLIVVIPATSAIPERKPAATPAGSLSLKKLTKTERASLYTQLVCGHVIVTLREAFAVVPGIASARIVAIRPSDPDACGRRRPEVIAAARCTAQALQQVRWDQADAVRVFNDCCTERMLIHKGIAKELQPIPLSGEPGLVALLQSIDMEELLRD